MNLPVGSSHELENRTRDPSRRRNEFRSQSEPLDDLLEGLAIQIRFPARMPCGIAGGRPGDVLRVPTASEPVHVRLSLFPNRGDGLGYLANQLRRPTQLSHGVGNLGGLPCGVAGNAPGFLKKLREAI